MRKIKKSQIPNLLTFLRIILIIPIFILLILANNGRSDNIYIYNTWENSNIYLFQLIAGIIFIFSSLTDFLDGKIARKYNWVSNFGKLWDPIADKLLVNTVLICFSTLNYIPFWLVILNILRDITVDGIRQYALAKGIVLHSNWVGKWKTTLQMFGFVIIFFVSAISYNELNTISNKLIYWLLQNGFLIISTFLAFWSAALYYVKLKKSFYVESY